MAVAERLACCRLLAQRSLLELHEDRVILGAKSLLAKYASGEHVWMEVALKLASAALVSLVAMKSLWLSMAILLGMSAIIFTVRPYAQPHMNSLQGMAFACHTAFIAISRRFEAVCKLFVGCLWPFTSRF